jgi:cytochrome c556
MRKFVTIVVAGAALFAASAAYAAGAGDIKYRQSVMKALAGHLGAAGTIVKGEGGDKADLKGHAHAINELARMSGNVFAKGSGTEAGETAALPAIWEKPDDFGKVLVAFQTAAADFAKAADSGDSAAIGKAIGELGKTGCGGCHRDYRKK